MPDPCDLGFHKCPPEAWDDARKRCRACGISKYNLFQIAYRGTVDFRFFAKPGRAGDRPEGREAGDG